MGNINPINHDGIKVDDIAEKTGSHGIEIANTVKIDQIDELTPANGVVVDSLTIKDGGVSGSGDLVTSGNVQCDTIIEKTATSGVTIDSTLLKDGGVTATGTIDTSGTLTTDTINEHTGGAGVTIDGTLIKDKTIKIDTITEDTTSNGVDIDSVHVEDGGIVVANNAWIQALDSGASATNIMKINSSNELEFTSSLPLKKESYTTTVASSMTIGTPTMNFEEWIVVADQVMFNLDFSYSATGGSDYRLLCNCSPNVATYTNTRVIGHGTIDEDGVYNDVYVYTSGVSWRFLIAKVDFSNFDSSTTTSRVKVMGRYTST